MRAAISLGMRIPLLLLSLSLLPAAAGTKLNQIQAIGSHNSYHLAPPETVLAVMGKMNPDWKQSWNYSHPPLTAQLGAEVRQFELDLYADPDGGRFAAPFALKLAAAAGAKTVPFDPEGVMKNPGFKILHIPDIDCWSSSSTLKAALAGMKAWSDANPRHLPVMILIECKDEVHAGLPTKPLPFDRGRLLDLEQEILRTIPVERIIRPDDIRAGAPTLRQAVLTTGWPEVDSLRGRFLLALDNEGELRDAYLEGNPSLEGRLLFASAPNAEHPAAAWFKMNDPVRDFAEIQKRVKAGFLVRTRADENKPDPKMKEKAFASGAQWVSTDHFTADDPARVAFDGGALVRINPVSGEGAEPVKP